MDFSPRMSRLIYFLLVLFCVLVTYLFKVMPWGIGPWNGIPDLGALLLLYGAINQPCRVGFCLAFLMGGIVDVLEGTVLGIHSLSYSIALYSTLRMQRQIELAGFWQQAIIVLIVMLAIQTINLLINIIILQGTFRHWGYFLSSFTTAILWIPISNIILYCYHQFDKPLDKSSL